MLPRTVRVELARLRRLPGFVIEHRAMARPGPAAGAIVLARHASPLRRGTTVVDERLQRGKEANVALAAARIDGCRLEPGAVFSYHHAVGWPTRLRGFRFGLELHAGEMAAGVGGGACQVANLLYYLALCGAQNVVERHRHSLDLFPDDGRTVPFGCGATVFYNWADLRVANPLDQAVSIHLTIADGELRGELRVARDPGLAVRIYEVDHRFVRDAAGVVWRENQLRRCIRDAAGELLIDQEIARNRARVAYAVDEARLAPAAVSSARVGATP
ncbi:MAG: VanW family protein [Myxococcales bacterium]|nr:VanW family protein [Myxococcales bacterium]